MPAATHQEQKLFFEQVRKGFGSALVRTGEVLRDFELAGVHLRLRFAGEALVSALTNGLACPVSSVPPVFRSNRQPCEICIWDSESTGVEPASPPRHRWDFTGRGSIWGFHDPQYKSAFSWAEGSVSVMDSNTGQAVYWLPSQRSLPLWLMAAPLRTILHWCMDLNGRQLVHGAAVGHGGRGVLMPGRGGAGKSSTALACLESGLDFVADDYLALVLDPAPCAFPLYATAKLDPRSLDLYPRLSTGCRIVTEPGFNKVILFLKDSYTDQLPPSLPIGQILQPSITNSPVTEVDRLKPREALKALAAETLVHLPHSGARTAEFLERLSSTVPCAKLRLGTVRSEIPRVVRAAIAAPPAVSSSESPRADVRPYVSLIVHYSEPDPGELEALALAIEADRYPRTELVVTVCGAGPEFVEQASHLPGLVRVLRFEEPVWTAFAWNRAIRESFADWLFFLEPGDRLVEGALDALVQSARQKPAAAWIRGQCSESPDRPLRGALVKKGAFLECGLFNLRFVGREQQEWVARAKRAELIGRDTLTRSLCRPPAAASCDTFGNTASRVMKTWKNVRPDTPESV